MDTHDSASSLQDTPTVLLQVCCMYKQTVLIGVQLRVGEQCWLIISCVAGAITLGGTAADPLMHLTTLRQQTPLCYPLHWIVFVDEQRATVGNVLVSGHPEEGKLANFEAEATW